MPQDHALAVFRTAELVPGRVDVAGGDVRGLVRVDVDRVATAVLRHAVGVPGDRATVEGRGVVRPHRSHIGTLVEIDRSHLVDREPGLEHLGEHHAQVGDAGGAGDEAAAHDL